LMRNRERDAQAVRRLQDDNWRVAIVWECSIRADATSVVDQLQSFLFSDLSFLELVVPKSE
jgi:G:T-mismatch repair DNA endonuclease (very short patch repair protein)